MLDVQDISKAELEIMRVVWAQAPLTGRQIIDSLQPISDWKEGTIKSLISRLIQKDFLDQDTSHRPYQIRPKISYKEALWQRTFDEYQYICSLDRADFIHDLLDKTILDQRACQGLIDHLQTKLETAPHQITCSCPPGQCRCQDSCLQKQNLQTKKEGY